MDAPLLYHLALADEWEAAVATGSYTRSTLGRTLEEEGFIHLSRKDQVAATADRFYRGIGQVVLVALDPVRLRPPVVQEPVGEDTFPHLYGPLDPGAAVEVTRLSLRPDGTLALPGGFR